MRVYISPSFIILLLASLPFTATAATIPLSAILNGEQASSGVETDGSGSATITLDDVSNVLTWDVNWLELAGDFTVAHFHGPAAPGENAGVQVSIPATGSPATGSEVITSQQATDLLAGLWYINIHSDAAPSGEIRGQVIPTQVVPVPTSIVLMLSGLIGFAAFRHH